MYTVYLDGITTGMKLELRLRGYSFGFLSNGDAYIHVENAQRLARLATLLAQFE